MSIARMLLRRGRGSVAVVLVGCLVASCSSDSISSSPPTPSASAVTTDQSTDTTEPPATDATIPETPDTEAPDTETPSTNEDPPTTTEPVDVSATPYGVELANVSTDGVRSLESALALFAIAVAPLPGVDATTDRTGVRSGTLAIKNLLARYDELTPEQQAAVDAALQPPAAAETEIVPAGFVRKPEGPLLDSIVAAVKQYRADIAARLGQIPGDIEVVVASLPELYGQAVPKWDGAGDTYSGCTVTINAIDNTDAVGLVNTVAHEVFHCFQYGLAPSKAVWEDSGDWMSEGSAEWAAAELTLPDGSEAQWWEAYLTEIQVPLFARTYEAIGFFAHLAETGTDPWSVFPAMFAASGSPAEFDASGANGDAFMTTWGSSLIRDPSRGAAWDTDGPGITDDKTTPISVTIANGDNKAFSAVAYATSEDVLDITADVLIIQASGFARLNDKIVDIPKVTASTFCTKIGGCGVCPDGTPLPDNPPPLAPGPLLAVSSNAVPSSGTLVGLTVEDYCREHTAVWTYLERPASPGVLAGNVVEIYGCSGPFGPWSGVLRSGGLDDGAGFTVDFSDVPVSFAFAGKGAQSTHTAANGNVPTPIGNITLALELDIGIDAEGSTMSITGTGTAGTDIITVSQYRGNQAESLPIEPAPEGSCP